MYSDAQEEAFIEWLSKTGVAGDLTPLITGLRDIADASSSIYHKILPSLLELEPNLPSPQIEDLSTDLLGELMHISEHVNDMTALVLKLSTKALPE
mgnify:CR=1 FL=1